MYFDEPVSVRRAKQRTSQRRLVWCFALLCADIALLLGITWRNGAYNPALAYVCPTLVALALIGIILIQAALLFQRKDSRASSAALATLSLIILLIGWPLLNLRVERYAIRRDIGTRSQVWAVEILRKPRAQVLDSNAPDWQQGKIKDSLVPEFLKKGRFKSASIDEPNDWIREPHVALWYTAGHLGSRCYFLGRTDMQIPTSQSVRKELPGLYTYDPAY